MIIKIQIMFYIKDNIRILVIQNSKIMVYINNINIEKNIKHTKLF